MPTPSPPTLTLAELIERFREDCAMAHDFVKGDENLDIHGTDGDYPSLAKLVKETRNLLLAAMQVQLGFTIRTYHFSPSLTWQVMHVDVPTTNFKVSITNNAGDTVYEKDIIPISDTEFLIEFTEPEGGIVNVTYIT